MLMLTNGAVCQLLFHVLCLSVDNCLVSLLLQHFATAANQFIRAWQCLVILILKCFKQGCLQ